MSTALIDLRQAPFLTLLLIGRQLFISVWLLQHALTFLTKVFGIQPGLRTVQIGNAVDIS
jgi:hypothetical protein